MIIITKKLHPRRLAAGCLLGACAVILLGAAFGLVQKVPSTPVSTVASADGSDIRTNADRIVYLESLGWLTAAQPAAEESLTLPDQFGDAYQDYLTLQRSQGFDLEKYAGETIKRYTYQVKNYPGLQENIWACLLVCKHQIIGGEIFCNQGDGFTQSLEFPMKASE